MKKQRNKLSVQAIEKIRARYQSKYNEFIELPLNDEIFEGVAVKRGLKTIYKEDKMSSTDRMALAHAINYVLQQNKAKLETGINRIDQLEEMAKNKIEDE